MTKDELYTLIEGCRSNNRDAQETIYKHYFNEMFVTCKRYAEHSHDALTILNDGFLKVFKNILKYDQELGNFKSWLKTVIIHTAIDYLRANKKGTQLIHIDTVQEQGIDDFKLSHDWSEEEISEHLKLLPSVTRMVINLFAFDGQSYKEISGSLGITEATCRWHVAEARRRLRLSMQLNKLKDRQA